MLTPTDPLAACDSDLERALHDMKPNLLDLICAFFEREIAFFGKVWEVSQKLSDFSFDEVWLSVSNTKNMDEKSLALLCKNKPVDNMFADWRLLSRRILNKPKIQIRQVRKNELKIFLRLFILNYFYATSTQMGSSFEGRNVNIGSWMGGLGNYEENEILSEINYKAKRTNEQSHTNKPKSETCVERINTDFTFTNKNLTNQLKIHVRTARIESSNPGVCGKRSDLAKALPGNYSEDEVHTKNENDSPPRSSSRNHIKIDIKDLCGPNVLEDARDPPSDLCYDDENNLSIDSNEEEVMIFQEKELKNAKKPEAEDTNKSLPVDVENLALRFDYDDCRELVKEEEKRADSSDERSSEKLERRVDAHQFEDLEHSESSQDQVSNRLPKHSQKSREYLNLRGESSSELFRQSPIMAKDNRWIAKPANNSSNTLSNKNESSKRIVTRGDPMNRASSSSKNSNKYRHPKVLTSGFPISLPSQSSVIRSQLRAKRDSGVLSLFPLCESLYKSKQCTKEDKVDSEMKKSLFDNLVLTRRETIQDTQQVDRWVTKDRSGRQSIVGQLRSSLKKINERELDKMLMRSNTNSKSLCYKRRSFDKTSIKDATSCLESIIVENEKLIDRISKRLYRKISNSNQEISNTAKTKKLPNGGFYYIMEKERPTATFLKPEVTQFKSHVYTQSKVPSTRQCKEPGVKPFSHSRTGSSSIRPNRISSSTGANHRSLHESRAIAKFLKQLN